LTFVSSWPVIDDVVFEWLVGLLGKDPRPAIRDPPLGGGTVKTPDSSPSPPTIESFRLMSPPSYRPSLLRRAWKKELFGPSRWFSLPLSPFFFFFLSAVRTFMDGDTTVGTTAVFCLSRLPTLRDAIQPFVKRLLRPPPCVLEFLAPRDRCLCFL